MPDIPSKFQKDPYITFRVILRTHRQTNKVRQKHNLLDGGNKVAVLQTYMHTNKLGLKVKQCTWYA